MCRKAKAVSLKSLSAHAHGARSEEAVAVGAAPLLPVVGRVPWRLEEACEYKCVYIYIYIYIYT